MNPLGIDVKITKNGEDEILDFGVFYLGPLNNFREFSDKFRKTLSNGGRMGVVWSKEDVEMVFPSKTETFSGNFVVPRKSDITVLTSTDENCTVYFNEDPVRIGKGVFYYLSSGAVFTQVSFRHEGDCVVEYLHLDYETNDTLVSTCFNLRGIYGRRIRLMERIGEEGYEPCCIAYKPGHYGATTSPMNHIQDVHYSRRYRQTTSKSSWVYSTTIEVLQSHPEMIANAERWGMIWDRDLVRSSYPPCIGVSVKEENVDDFLNMARRICPDLTSDFTSFDHELIEQTSEEKQWSLQKCRSEVINNIKKLIDAGLLERKPVFGVTE